MTGADQARVVAVSKSGQHRFSKRPCDQITLLAGIGIEGDAHAGVTVQHRSRVTRDPTQPNLRQVHLLHTEFFDEARAEGYQMAPGELGENVLTQGLDVLALSRDTLLHMGSQAVVRITASGGPALREHHGQAASQRFAEVHLRGRISVLQHPDTAAAPYRAPARAKTVPQRCPVEGPGLIAW